MSDYVLCPLCGTKLYGMEVHDREICEKRKTAKEFSTRSQTENAAGPSGSQNRRPK